MVVNKEREITTVRYGQSQPSSKLWNCLNYYTLFCQNLRLESKWQFFNQISSTQACICCACYSIWK